LWPQGVLAGLKLHKLCKTDSLCSLPVVGAAGANMGLHSSCAVGLSGEVSLVATRCLCWAQHCIACARQIPYVACLLWVQREPLRVFTTLVQWSPIADSHTAVAVGQSSQLEHHVTFPWSSCPCQSQRPAFQASRTTSITLDHTPMLPSYCHFPPTGL
jgi:hypothetical protein